MPDICDLILEDHHWFRARFAELDELRARDADAGELEPLWSTLADRLEVHAVAEEELFYPQLLAIDADEPLEETEDAITDHNSITEAVERARDLAIGTDAWWDAVLEAREANSSHTAEEDRGALPDFRTNADESVRQEIGAAWLDFHRERQTVDREERDVVDYVEDVADEDRAEDMEEFLEDE